MGRFALMLTGDDQSTIIETTVADTVEELARTLTRLSYISATVTNSNGHDVQPVEAVIFHGHVKWIAYAPS